MTQNDRNCTPGAPEPCLEPNAAWCYSPMACRSWGYCRGRNTDGCPDQDTRQRYRTEAAERKSQCFVDEVPPPHKQLP